jgi:hypothetical protein
VNWKVASGGGSVSSATSATDAAGIALSNWTLGAFADEQKVTAESARLSTISFTGTVPVATLTVSPVEVKLWPGDKTQLSAQARDAAGTVLGGVKPTWSTSQSAVATVAEGGMLSAIGAGEAIVKATFGGIESLVNATILPIVRVKAWSLDQTDVSGQRVTVEWGTKAAATALVAASPWGEAVFRLEAPIPESASVRISVDAENTSSRRYHPAVIEVKGGELPTEIKVGLVPLRFTIPFGCFAGQTVDVSAEAALAVELGSDGIGESRWGPFYRSEKSIFGTPSDAVPIPVAISSDFNEADATAIWAALQDLAGCIWPGGNLYSRVDSLTGKGLKVAWNPGGSYYQGGTVYLSITPSRTPLFADAFVETLQHETIHSLGFYHLSACQTSSVMRSGWCDPDTRVPDPPRVTPADVAYIRLMQLAYELRKAHGIPPENFFTAAARGEELFGR